MRILFLFFFLTNTLTGQDNCLKILNDFKKKSKKEKPQTYSQISEFSNDFYDAFYFKRCDSYNDEYQKFINDIIEYSNHLKYDGDPSGFYQPKNIFSVKNPPIDISNLWFNNIFDYTEMDFKKFIYEDNINVRIAPTTDSPIVTSLPIGKEVIVNEVTNEKYSINNVEYPWIKVSFLNNEILQEGYLVAKFLSEKSYTTDEYLFLVAPQYNYEQQYQIKTIKNNKEISKINLSNKYGYSSDSGVIFEFISNNINNVEILHVFWCYAVCGRSCDDEYIFWNGKKFYNASSDNDIDLSFGWKFDDSLTKLVYLNNFFFYKGNKEIYYDDEDMADGDYPQDEEDFDSEIYTEYISELIWTGEKLKKITTKTELIENLEKKSGKWYLNNKLYSGNTIEKWKNGKIKSKKTIKKGLEDGIQFEFFDNEKIKCITNWSKGKWNGQKTWYLDSGEIDEVKEYLDWKEVKVTDSGSMHLDDSHNYPSSENDEYSIIEDDIVIEEELEIEYADTDEEEEEEEAFLFTVVEDPPIFYNCNRSASREEKQACFQQGVMNHVINNHKYPAISKEMGIQEKIYVGFVIDKTGIITDVKVLRGEDKYLKEEAIRLIKSIPELIPAKQRGQAVSCSFTVPITFTLQ